MEILFLERGPNLERMNAKTKAEILRFLFVGGMAVVIDATFYFLFAKFEILDPSWAKRVSFLIGSAWAFFMNKFFTFRQSHFRVSQPITFGIVYMAGFLLNSILHDVLLNMTSLATLSFLFATGVSTCTNFVGLKWIVFRSRREINEAP